MRQISKGYLEFLQNANRFKARKEIKAANKIRHQKRIAKKRAHNVLRAHTIEVPRILSIDRKIPRHLFCKFIKKLKQSFNDKKCGHIILDLSKTKHYIASGAILFSHVLSREVERHYTKKISLIHPEENSVQDQVLAQIGIYEICRLQKKVLPTADSVVHWRVLKGRHQDSTIVGSFAQEQSVNANLQNDTVDQLKTGLNEAITNIIHHAYPPSINGKITNYGWQMFFQIKDSTLFVIVSDIGLGISETIKMKNDWIKFIQQHLLLNLISESDSKYIEIAAIPNKSSTLLSGRGKGIPDIITTIKNTPGGKIDIFSNKGLYSIEQQTQTPKLKDFKNSIHGTIIRWSIPIGEKIS